MTVGQYVAFVVDDDTRSQIGALLGLGPQLVAEKVTEHRVFQQRMPRQLCFLRGRDVHDSGHGFLGGIAERAYSRRQIGRASCRERVEESVAGRCVARYAEREWR